MNHITQALGRFIREEEGATAVEYALLAVLIALAIVVGATALGTQINAKLQAIADFVQKTNTPK